MTDAHIDVAIVTRNSASHIGPCVESALAEGGSPIIVDNGSTDNTLEIVRSKCPDARIIETGENLGYGKAMNIGFGETSGEFVILSNPDVVFLPSSIGTLIGYLRKNPRVGVVGPQQMFPDRSWQRSYGDLPGVWSGMKDAVGINTLHNGVRKILWPRKVDWRPKEVPYTDGAVLALRRAAFSQMGGFDEEFYFYSDESDLCARLRKAGWRVVFLPASQVIHVRGADSAKVDRSDRFVKYMVTSQSLLARKTLPEWKARIYFRFQVCHFTRLRLMYRLADCFGADRSLMRYKASIANAFARVWEEACETPLNHQPKAPAKET